METFPTVLALCAGNPPVTGEFPSQPRVNNRKADYLRRRRAHYGVIVMMKEEVKPLTAFITGKILSKFKVKPLGFC